MKFRQERLTEREEEVLALTEQGKTDEQIAEILNISPYTAREHQRKVRRKLDATRV